MSIRITCECGTRLKASDEAAGKRLRCPKCRTSIAVPVAKQADTVGYSALKPFDRPPASEPLAVTATPARKSLSKPILLSAIAAFVVGGLGTATVFLILNRTQPRQASAPAVSSQAAATPIQPEPKPATTVAEVPKARDPAEQRLRALLARVDAAYSEDAEKIAQIVVYMINELKRAGQTLTPAEALEGSLHWPMPGYFSREKRSEFTEYSALYLMNRIQQKLSHAQAIREMHYLASSVHLQSKQDPDPKFEAAFEAASPGCRLAMVESHDLIREDDPLAEYYGGLVDKVADAYALTSKEASETTILVIAQLHKFDQRPHPDQVLQGVLSWRSLPSDRTGRMKFFEFLQKYEQLREIKKLSHAQACVALLGQAPEDARPDP